MNPAPNAASPKWPVGGHTPPLWVWMAALNPRVLLKREWNPCAPNSESTTPESVRTLTARFRKGEPEVDRSKYNEWLQSEEARKAHLNGAVQPHLPINMNPPPPAVWGGWGQQRPRVRMPPALTRMGFPFVPPKPPPITESEKRAVEFRKSLAGIEYNSGTGGFNPPSPR